MKGEHRTVAGTKAARKGMAETGRISYPRLHAQPQEIRDWNAQVERAKESKAIEKAARRAVNKAKE